MYCPVWWPGPGKRGQYHSSPLHFTTQLQPEPTFHAPIINLVYLTVLMMFLLKLNISIMKIFLSDSGGERQQVEGGSHCEYVMRPRGPLIPTTDVLECWHSHDLSFQHKLLHMSVLDLRVWIMITLKFMIRLTVCLIIARSYTILRARYM